MFLEIREEMKDVKRPVDMKEGGGGRKVDETEWGLRDDGDDSQGYCS